MPQRLDRINAFLEGVNRNRREILTPEGLMLEVEVANNGERLVAFLIDFLFWALATALLFLLLGALFLERMSGVVAVTIIFFLAFLLRNLYFIHFELVTQGSTPGKRIVNLRVVDRNGGPLRPGAVVARNLTREVEVFLPLGLFLSLPSGDGSNFWMSASYFGWVVLISALPFFNRDHLRAGDMIAGTMVISVPRRALLAEISQTRAKIVFNRRQLEAYGAFELQVLEELLRRPPSAETDAVRRQVCEKIRNRIGWLEPVAPLDTLEFLGDFYTAERAYLEGEQLFGRYHADKTRAPTA